MADPTLDVAEAVLEKWTPLANRVDPTTPYVPIQVLTGEALDLAYFIQKYWEARTVDGENVPGMKAGAQGGLFDENIAQELRELGVAVSNIHAEYNAVIGAAMQAPVQRGEFLLSELKSALAFLFDDGIEDEQDAELEQHQHIARARTPATPPHTRRGVAQEVTLNDPRFIHLSAMRLQPTLEGSPMSVGHIRVYLGCRWGR